VAAEIRLEALDLDHPLAGAHNEDNRFVVTQASGMMHEVFGKGAGRWPTATAVFADVMDAQRALLGRVQPRALEPLRLRA
jgi:homoserine dehydrogenase